MCGRLALIAVLWATATTSVFALEVPLTVTERAGIERVGNHVNAGVPFAKGAVPDAGKLGLFTAEGRPVPAAFIVRQKWQEDQSARWVTVHFATDAPAGGTVTYVVKDAAGAAPPYPIKTAAAADRITIDTGALKFTVVRDKFNVIDEAWFDATGKGQYGRPAVESGTARLVATITSGKYKVVNVKASLDQIGPAADNVAVAKSLELEESTPVRAVVKVTGQFMAGEAPTVDFVCRLYAMAGSPVVRVSFTVLNLTGKAWDQFHGFNELSLVVPAKVGDGLKYTLGASEGADVSGALKAGERAALLQPYSEHYFLSGVAQGQGKAKSLLTRRLGWADLSGSDAGLAVGVRYFWQLHPKGLAVGGDGALTVSLVPKQETKVEVPKDVVSQADTRVDLFTGGARTHEIALAFHAPAQKPAPLVLGVTDPLLAACPTAWYCQDTKAEGLLWDANPENFKPEHRPLIAEFQKKIDEVFTECAGPVRRGGRRGTEEYGFFSFGSGTEAKGDEYITPNDWLNTRWDGNYYDFPRACLVNFWRTGDLKYWDVAQDSALHLADIDIAHVNPGNPKLNGIEHVCPNRGHFRQFWGAEPFGVSGNMDSSKSQSLYDLYHMTGDAWFLDCALLVATYNMNHTGGALRAIGNRGLNLLLAYEQTGDKKYLDEAANWMKRTLVPRSPTQSWDQNWMYGLASEPLMTLYRTTGDLTFAQTAVNCTDSLINRYWKNDTDGVRPLTGFTLICFSNAYDLTGNENYLKKGLLMLGTTARDYAGGVKTFAQGFRLSPYFLHCLTKDYQPPKPVIEKSNATK
jgi:hypothetical protein